MVSGKPPTWAHVNLNPDLSNIVSSNNSSFYGSVGIKKASISRNEQVVECTVKHAVTVHVWGCPGAPEFLTLCVFTDIISASAITEMYKNKLLISKQR